MYIYIYIYTYSSLWFSEASVLYCWGILISFDCSSWQRRDGILFRLGTKNANLSSSSRGCPMHSYISWLSVTSRYATTILTNTAFPHLRGRCHGFKITHVFGCPYWLSKSPRLRKPLIPRDFVSNGGCQLRFCPVTPPCDMQWLFGVSILDNCAVGKVLVDRGAHCQCLVGSWRMFWVTWYMFDFCTSGFRSLHVFDKRIWLSCT